MIIQPTDLSLCEFDCVEQLVLPTSTRCGKKHKNVKLGQKFYEFIRSGTKSRCLFHSMIRTGINGSQPRPFIQIKNMLTGEKY